MASHHLRPMRIRHALSRKFDIPLDDLPTLMTVQNFVNYYSRTYMENHDRVDAIRAWIHANAFTGNEPLSRAFTFGWQHDHEGNLIVGNGSDSKPFIVGLSTKALVKRIKVPPESFVLHVDGTYKTNQCDYPVLVVGLSDSSRGFHLVALFVIPQETQPVLEACLLSLRRLYQWVTHKELVVQYAMADADQAQYNALASVFGSNPKYQFLMCFFHHLENVHKAVRSFPSGVVAAILRDIYDLHCDRTSTAFLRARDDVLRRWLLDPTLVEFTQYMCSQWLFGRFSTWQAFVTPSGYATTNNPAETFNASLKRDYTLHRRLKMGASLREFTACCINYSTTSKPFQFKVVPAKTLTRRVADMMRGQLLMMGGGHYEDGSCVGPSEVRVVSLPAQRVSVAPNKRTELGIAVSAQMGSNYTRKETEGQPWGWTVDIQHQWCPCDYCFVFGTCVHVLFALRVTAYVDSSGHEVLVRRNKRRRSAVNTSNVGGCPPLIGPALSFT